MQELVDLADVGVVSGHVSLPDKCSCHDTWNRVLGKDQKTLFED